MMLPLLQLAHMAASGPKRVAQHIIFGHRSFVVACGVRVAEGAKPVVLHAGEDVSAVNVDVGIAKGREPANVGVVDGVAPISERVQGGVDVAGVPQDDGVQDKTEDAELIFLAFPVVLSELPTLPVEDPPDEAVTGFLGGQLDVDLSAVGLVVRVVHCQQVQCLGDAPVLGERGTLSGRIAVTAEHPQEIVAGNSTVVEGAGHAEHVLPGRFHPVDGQLVLRDRAQDPVVGHRAPGRVSRQIRGTGMSATRGLN